MNLDDRLYSTNFNFPTGRYLPIDQKKCPICMHNFNHDELIATHTACRWAFHKNCMRDWLSENPKSICPMEERFRTPDCGEICTLPYSKVLNTSWLCAWRKVINSMLAPGGESSHSQTCVPISINEFVLDYLCLINQQEVVVSFVKTGSDIGFQDLGITWYWFEIHEFVSTILTFYLRLQPMFRQWLKQGRSFGWLFEDGVMYTHKSIWLGLSRGINLPIPVKLLDVEKFFRAYCEANDRARGLLAPGTSINIGAAEDYTF